MSSWVTDGDPALSALRSQAATSAENQATIDAAIVTYVKVRTRIAMRQRLRSFNLPAEFIDKFMDLRHESGCECTINGSCWHCCKPMTDEEANAILSSFARKWPVAKLLEVQTNLIEHDYDGTITA